MRCAPNFFKFISERFERFSSGGTAVANKRREIRKQKKSKLFTDKTQGGQQAKWQLIL
jgi:hypothetical protein